MQLFLSNHYKTTLTSSVSFIGIISICHPFNILFSHLIMVHYSFRVVLSYDASCFLLYVKWCLPRLIDKSFWKFAKLRNIFSEKFMFLMEYIYTCKIIDGETSTLILIWHQWYTTVSQNVNITEIFKIFHFCTYMFI